MSAPAAINTATAAPNIVALASGLWSNPANWNPRRVPADNDIVQIPAGVGIDLSSATAKLNGLWLQGRLNLVDTNGVLLNTRFTIITGVLQAGSDAQPFASNAAIELWGDDITQNVMGMGTKNLAVMAGGMLKLHGQNRLAWTKLDANTAAGSTRLTLKDDASSWRVGDKIVIASGSIDPRDAQVLTITAVNQKQIDVSPALAKSRYGTVQTFNNKILDQRPAIGLLTRNLVVRGAADSDATAFGGHIMVMAGGHAQVSGVDLQRMGQRGLPGRYPIHWHEAGDRLGDYAVANAINNSFQRAVVLHSTSQVLVDANVAYDVPNHAFVWAEDGDEVGNVMTRNLSVLVRTPEEKHFAFPINNPFFANSSQGESRAAGFWGRSLGKHVLRDNISAGVLEGFGFFVDLFTPAPDSLVDGTGMVFDGNTAHSTLVTLVTGNQINYPEATRGHGLMVTTGASPSTEHIFQNYTGYQNTSGAWLEDRATVLKNSIVADNGSGLIVLRGTVDDVTVVGTSANTTPTPRMVASVTTNSPAGIQIAGSNHGGKRVPLIRKATIINQQGAGILWDPENISPASTFEQVQFVNTPTKLLVSATSRFEFPEPPNHGFKDPNGFVLGNGVPAVVMMPDTTFFDPSCTSNNSIAAVICPMSSLIILHASQSLNLVESNGQITFLRYFNVEDESMPRQGAASWIGNGRQYQATGIDGGSVTLSFNESEGKSVEIMLPANSAPTKIVQSGQAIPAASSLSTLRSNSSTSYFYDAAQKQIVLRYVGTAASQSIEIMAAFVRQIAVGKAALAAVSTAADGLDYSVFANSASYQLRYGMPTSSATRSARVNSPTLNDPAFLSASTSGDTTVMRGYVYAPEDGFYRVALWGNGGGTSVWIGDTWIMGQPWAFINSNDLVNNALTTQVVSFQVNRPFSLRSGWHAVTVVHAKMPENNQGNTLHLRWSQPSKPDVWVYPNWKVGL
jgi:G8 domain